MADHKITFTYLNIRQSIVILLAKLVCIDVVLAFIVVALFSVLVEGGELFGVMLMSTSLFLSLFGLIGFIKVILSIYVVLLWLNEYYEITPDAIIHKTGIIFRKKQQYALNNIRVMDIQDNFLGELCNFATITLYDIRLNKYLDMYLIHNPLRYAHVIKELRPRIEMKEDAVS